CKPDDAIAFGGRTFLQLRRAPLVTVQDVDDSTPTLEREPVTPPPGPPVMPVNPPFLGYQIPQPYDPRRPPVQPRFTHVRPPKVFRALLSPDPAEHALLATLRAKPDDVGSRMVYADWLEDRGSIVHAQITRGVELDRAVVLQGSTAEWRAVASCAPV